MISKYENLIEIVNLNVIVVFHILLDNVTNLKNTIAKIDIETLLGTRNRHPTSFKPQI